MNNYDKKDGKQAKKKGGDILLFRPNTRNSEPVAWGDIDASIIRGAIDAVAKAGGALMFGITSDGGAYSICSLLDGNKAKGYTHTKDECEDQLTTLTEYCVDIIT